MSPRTSNELDGGGALPSQQRRCRVLVENAGHNVFEAHPEVQPLLVRFFREEAVSDTELTLPPPTFAIEQAAMG